MSLRRFTVALCAVVLIAVAGIAQTAPSKPVPAHNPRRVLVIGATEGFQHDSIPDAMAFVYNEGKANGLWDAVLSTDTKLITKADLTQNAKGLSSFDCIIFASTSGDLPLSDDQKRDLLAFIHEDGKCFIGIHASLTTGYVWPDAGRLLRPASVGHL
jgi:hypothetical protein